jgi:hypothetical protein
MKRVINILLKSIVIYSLIELIRLFIICTLNILITDDIMQMNSNQIMIISFLYKILPLIISVIMFLILRMYNDKELVIILILLMILYVIYPIHIYINIFQKDIFNNIISFILSMLVFYFAFRLYKAKRSSNSLS